jgi:diguanylate cyclase (GGDEF)-like protein
MASMKAMTSCTARRMVHGAVLGTMVGLAWLPLQAGGELNPLRDPPAHPLAAAALVMAAVAAFTAVGALLGRGEARLVEANRRLDELTVADPLTGLKNVRYFRARLAEAQAAALRSGEPLSLLVLDLDRFKQVNDRYGHLAGDAVLREAGRAILATLRSGDTAARLEGAVARMGGEEFAVLLPGADLEQACEVAERVLDAVRSARVRAGGGEVRVTASVGIASVSGPDTSAEELYARADRAMYAAKAAGRDRVAGWVPEPALAAGAVA